MGQCSSVQHGACFNLTTTKKFAQNIQQSKQHYHHLVTSELIFITLPIQLP